MAVNMQRPEEKKGRNHQTFLWQFGNPGGSVEFAFHLGRGGEAADSVLAGYKGILQTDGYAGYNSASKDAAVRAGCWSHYPESSIIQSGVSKRLGLQGKLVLC